MAAKPPFLTLKVTEPNPPQPCALLLPLPLLPPVFFSSHRNVSLKNPSGLETSGRTPPLVYCAVGLVERAGPAASGSASNLFSQIAMPVSRCQGRDFNPGLLALKALLFRSALLSGLSTPVLAFQLENFDLSLIPQVFTEFLLGARPHIGCTGVIRPWRACCLLGEMVEA